MNNFEYNFLATSITDLVYFSGSSFVLSDSTSHTFHDMKLIMLASSKLSVKVEQYCKYLINVWYMVYF